MDLSTPAPPAAHALSSASEAKLIAVLEVMHFVAKADGFLSAEELRQFLKFARTATGGKIDATRLGDLVTSWGKRKVTDIPARLRELSKILDDESTCRAAYDLASKMAAADGKVESQEMTVLEMVEEALDIR